MSVISLTHRGCEKERETHPAPVGWGEEKADIPDYIYIYTQEVYFLFFFLSKIEDYESIHSHQIFISNCNYIHVCTWTCI